MTLNYNILREEFKQKQREETRRRVLAKRQKAAVARLAKTSESSIYKRK